MLPEPRATLTPRFILGAFLVLMGGALILAQLGVVTAEDATRFWPAAMILIGLSMLQRTTRRPFGAVILIITGSWLLLKTLGLVKLDPWEFLGPLILVVVGARIMLRHRELPPNPNVDGASAAGASAAAQSQRYDGYKTESSEHGVLFAVLSGCRRRWAHTVFRSAEATSVMGGCELDLRDAQMGAGGTAQIDVFAVMGGVNIYVPCGWTVLLQVTPILGGVDDSSRSIASTPRQQLIVRGTVIMGGVEISN